MARLKDILQQQRKKNFVGRQKELDFFTNLLKQKEPSHHLIYIFGPGGQGKTTLLKQFADECKELAIPFISLDSRYIEANPENFKQVFNASSPWDNDILNAIDTHEGPVVLMIDTYEKLKPLDDWLRMDFLPELPGNIITVLSGRHSLSTNWKTDAGWQSITKSFALQELSNEESKQLLLRRNIPEEKIKRIVDFTHGHPLALSIVADMFDQRNDSRFDPLDSPDIMKTLLEQFVQEVPSPAHKAALELCSLVSVTTEKIIEEVLGAQLAHGLFNWLTTLTFIEKGPLGIYLHDIVRDAIVTELQWRNPDWYRHLHIKTQQFYISRLLKQSGESQRALLFGLIFLHRTNPAVKPFFEFQETGSTWQEKMKEEDREDLIGMVKKFEGKEAADMYAKWMVHEAAEAWVFRDADKIPAGMTLKINIHQLKGKTHDPVINHVLQYSTGLKLQEGQMMVAFRNWMGRDHYQNVSGIQSAIFLAIVQYYFSPGLAVSMLSCAHPDFWQQVLNYADLHHIHELDYDVEMVPHGWYLHDWRERPPLAWLELMGKREINETETMDATISPGKITEQEFADAVYDVLKNIDSPKKLMGNLLLQCRFVKNNNELEPGGLNLALTLADKVKQAVSSLESSAKDEALHRILYRSFINPVGSQEQTADFLYMSFSTYRRNLKKAVDRIADILWLEENQAS
jgi:ATPase family associated with various cellular activities (AAA)